MFETAKQGRASASGKPSLRKTHATDRLPQGAAVKARPPAADLDSEANLALHRKLMGYYTQELERQADNRSEMATDEEFYDNFQHSAEEKALLESRGQDVIVYNVTATAIDWVTGTQKRQRTDYKVLPRLKVGGRAAELKTGLMKYLDDVNRYNFHESDAFEECVKAGLGWLESGVSDESGDEPIYARAESWRNMLHDSAGIEKDGSDGRYQFRTKWVDQDVLDALAPSRKDLIARCVQNANQMGSWDLEYGDEHMDSVENDISQTSGLSEAAEGYTRPRVRVIECWYRVPTEVEKMKGGQFNGELFDPMSGGHYDDLVEGASAVISRVEMTVHFALMTTEGLLYSTRSPYRHNRFPFTPIWCYRRAKTRLPYGVVRRIRDIQRDINKRASKALSILSSNKTIMERGAVPDLDAYLEESSRPDAVIVVEPNKRLDMNVDRDLAPAHLDLMSRGIAMIQQASGITDENLGRETNASSGKAIMARQDQGSLATAGIFDHLRLAKQVHGEKQLSLVEQFISEPKTFRLTNIRGGYDFVDVNSEAENVEDDITATKADFIISEADWQATLRQSSVEALVAMLSQLGPVAPQAVLVTLDLIVEGMDIPNRDEIVKRLREATGMRDPDSNEPTPEEQQKMLKAQEAEERQTRMQEAEIADKEASARQKAAQAEKLGTDVQKILSSIAGEGVATQKAALEAALAALQVPQAVPVADRVLHEAGFKSRTESEEDQEVEAKAADLEQLAMEGAAMQEAAAMQQNPEGMPPDGSQAMPPQADPMAQPPMPQAGA